MSKIIVLIFLIILSLSAGNNDNKKELAAKILADQTMKKVDDMARELMKR